MQCIYDLNGMLGVGTLGLERRVGAELVFGKKQSPHCAGFVLS